MDEFTLTLDSPITEEQWDMLTDVDFDHANEVIFRTKHGKEVTFVKVIRCRDCKYREETGTCGMRPWLYLPVKDNCFCSEAERRTDG